MSLQYITDAKGIHTAVLIPIQEWEILKNRYSDLAELEKNNNKPPLKLSELAGKLSYETAEEMLNYVAESRKEWDDREQKQGL